MKSLWIKLPILCALLLGLPALGILLSGNPLDQYLEFPPQTQFIPKKEFSWIAFVFILSLVLSFFPFLFRPILHALTNSIAIPAKATFPWWGWSSVFALMIFWIIAWGRFEIFSWLQEHTFFPLWACYILIINGLTYRRLGTCLLIKKPVFYVGLFPLSLGFWWFFEYLNRFVQNWSYSGIQYGPLKYFILASLAFSTVLPAVLGTTQLLLSYSWLRSSFSMQWRLTPNYPRIFALFTLIIFSLGLGFVGVLHDYLFPLLWISPVVIILSLKTLFGEQHLLHLHSINNQRLVLASMLAALICGFFWEMWNYWSLVKWNYDIPFVHRFKVFEMPILGYAGYFPFGIECTVISSSLAALMGFSLEAELTD